MAKRSELRDAAKAEYIERRSGGEKVNLRELAQSLGANYKTIRDWKQKDRWDEAVPPPKKRGPRAARSAGRGEDAQGSGAKPGRKAGASGTDFAPKRKRGGQPGNQNSKGHQNAAGPHAGAPLRNTNAEKDGAYSTVYFDTLTDEERDMVDTLPLEARPALEHEMKILKFRENKILLKIAEYEKAPEDALYTSSVLDMRVPKGGRDGEKQSMGMYTKDSAFKRVQSLQEALYKVQGRISRIADSLRAMDESARRFDLEQKRLKILRMRAGGGVELPDLEESDDVPDKELEDIDGYPAEGKETERNGCPARPDGMKGSF